HLLDLEPHRLAVLEDQRHARAHLHPPVLLQPDRPAPELRPDPLVGGDVLDVIQRQFFHRDFPSRDRYISLLTASTSQNSATCGLKRMRSSRTGRDWGAQAGPAARRG